MKKAVSFRIGRFAKGLASFTLIELLVVMAIIAILAALILSAGSGVWTKAARSRAASEIQAMSAALEGYKTDNGIYPSIGTINLITTGYSGSDGSSGNNGGVYQQSSQVLYTALSGQTNYNDVPLSAGKSYMNFKVSQLGNATAATGTAPPASTYVKDPWGYSYGYSTGNSTGATTNAPYNGWGFFDLWSTGGILQGQVATKASLTNTWVSNWQ